jgi:hypothetical protein
MKWNIALKMLGNLGNVGLRAANKTWNGGKGVLFWGVRPSPLYPMSCGPLSNRCCQWSGSDRKAVGRPCHTGRC